MLYLSFNEEKTLTFEVDINGVGGDDLSGSVRFIYENVEYGFPVTVGDNKITSTIKPLDKIIDNIKNGTVLPARLELNTKDYFFSPWQGEIKIQTPVAIEAVLHEDKEEVGIAIKAKVVASKRSSSRNIVTERKMNKKEQLKEMLKNLTEKDIYEYMTRAGTKDKKIQEIVLESARKQAESGDLLKVFTEVVKALKKPKRLRR